MEVALDAAPWRSRGPTSSGQKEGGKGGGTAEEEEEPEPAEEWEGEPGEEMECEEEGFDGELFEEEEGPGGEYTPGRGRPQQQQQQRMRGDEPISLDALRKRIAWLNSTGGFQEAIQFKEVARSAEGLDTGKVMEILKYLEEHQEKINEPTRWVCSAFSRSLQAKEEGGLPPHLAAKLQRRVKWLNTVGGLNNTLACGRVEDAATGIPFAKVLDVLQALQDRGEHVEDPTAWVCATLRKAAKEPLIYEQFQHHDRDRDRAPRHERSDREPARRGQWIPSDNFDQELRRRIHWLNNDGGFGNDIFYLKVSDACQGLDPEQCFRILDGLQDKGPEEIQDPTAWICNGLQKVRERFHPHLPPPGKGRKGGKGGGAGGKGVGGGKGGRRDGIAALPEPPPSYRGGGQYGGKASGRSTEEQERQLKRRIAWLNGEGGFDNSLSYQKIKTAGDEFGGSVELPLQVLQRLQESRDNIEDPTSWVVAGVRKAFRQEPLPRRPLRDEAFRGAGFRGEGFRGEAPARRPLPTRKREDMPPMPPPPPPVP